MSDSRFFFGTGPVAPVLLRASTMDHAKPHLTVFASEEEAWAAAQETLTNPDAMHANPNRPGLPEKRTGHKRYVRYDAAIGMHIVIPARVLSEEEAAGSEYAPFEVSAGTHSAVTLFTTDVAPTDFLIKRWRT